MTNKRNRITGDEWHRLAASHSTFAEELRWLVARAQDCLNAGPECRPSTGELEDDLWVVKLARDGAERFQLALQSPPVRLSAEDELRTTLYALLTLAGMHEKAAQALKGNRRPRGHPPANKSPLPELARPPGRPGRFGLSDWEVARVIAGTKKELRVDRRRASEAVAEDLLRRAGKLPKQEGLKRELAIKETSKELNKRASRWLRQRRKGTN